MRQALERLCTCTAPSGFEGPAAAVAAELLRPLVDEVSIDRMGNVLGVRRSKTPGAPKLLLDAHLDEIGLIVTGVEDGFITGETADAVMAYMNAIEAAKQITDDIDARYKAFADAEALLITNALVIPRGMSVPAYLATRLNYWEGQYASIGFSNKRLKGIHVLDHYISMDEYEANRDAR